MEITGGISCSRKEIRNKTTTTTKKTPPKKNPQKIINTKPLFNPSLVCSYGMETISLNAGPTDSVSVPN